MKSKLWMIGLLLILAVICSASLAIVNMKTAPIIKRNNELQRMKTVLDVFGILYDRKNTEAIKTTYNTRITESVKQGLTLYHNSDSGQNALYLTGGGFQGPIAVVVALEQDTITGFKVVSQIETPGLGARISEERFQQSFIGKKVSGGISMVKTGNAGPAEFDAITGATETSRSLAKILTRGFTLYFTKE
jgi:RnfABCDGE-type electron transport complex G subunit